MTTEKGPEGESPWSEVTAEEMRESLVGLSTTELAARWSVGDEYDDYYEAVARERTT